MRLAEMVFTATESARNFGIEFEARKNLGFIADPLEDLYFAGNFTIVNSKITIGEDNRGMRTSTERALQGQSPYVLNAQIGYVGRGVVQRVRSPHQRCRRRRPPGHLR